MNRSLQERFDNLAPKQEIKILQGEYKGPFTITKPCTIDAGGATFWASEGPVLRIESSGVTIKNALIEVTGDPKNKDTFTAIESKAKDLKLFDVEVFGQSIGVGSEDGEWKIPRVIQLGEFYAERNNVFFIFVELRNSAEIVHKIKDLQIEPCNLKAGSNKIKISTGKMRDKSILYGELLIKSALSRRIYISGKACKAPANFEDEKIVYGQDIPLDSSSLPQEFVAPAVSDPLIINLKRGQRVGVPEAIKQEIKVVYEHASLKRALEIDAYAFLLDAKSKVKRDEDLVFFGNPLSLDSSLSYAEGDSENIIKIDLSRLNPDYERIAIAYSIYGDNANLNFSKIVSPVVRVFLEGKERYRYSIEGLMMERTIVALEFYKHKDEWKINAVGSGYKDGLSKLCMSYGVNVD